MRSYIIRRLLLGILVLFLVSVVVFGVMRLLPGDPLILFMSQQETEAFTEQQILELKKLYGLDKPLIVQYLDWMNGVLHGNLGESYPFREDVAGMVVERLPVTLFIASLATILGSSLGIFFGVICAVRRGKWIDTILTVMANLGITLPNFWVGILLIYIFAFKLNLLPIHGYTSPFQNFGLSMAQLIMPVFCLSLNLMAGLTRQTRSSMLEIIQQDYIRTAWAKGLRERAILIRHTIKNALIPVVTTMGMHVSNMIAGSILIETVFNIPGMGRMIAEAIFNQDYQTVQGCVLVVAVGVVMVNLIVDISYSWIDPRIRYH